MTDTFAYNNAGELLSETFSGGTLANVSVVSGFDNLLRRTTLTPKYSGSALLQETFGYDNASRLQTVTALDSGSTNIGSATYAYVANSPLVGQILFTNGGLRRMTTTKQFDNLNRLTSISSVPSGSSPLSFSYTYNTSNQRTRALLADNSYWRYKYDALGQVTSGKKYWSDQIPVAGQQFEYGFDDIGNRTMARMGGDASGGNLRQAVYTPNNLNEYSQRSVPGTNDVIGIAIATNTVTVNGVAAYRKGEYFRGTAGTNNTGVGEWENVTVSSAGNSTSGNMFIPKTPEVFQYDLDGNLTEDGRWDYTWDAENRLVKVQSRTGAPAASKRQVSWEFDGQGRRIRQTTSDGNSGTYNVVEDLKFISDGWRNVAELNATNNALICGFYWGLDLSDTMDAAGGIGGLLMLHSAANGTHFYEYDGNGDVVGLVKATDGTGSATYEYGPFGEVIRSTGTVVDENRFQFSTKPFDRTLDVQLFEYRIRRPDLTWLTRDPITETGFKLLRNGNSRLSTLLGNAEYDATAAFVHNDALTKYDFLGLCDPASKCGDNVTQPLTRTLDWIQAWYNSSALSYGQRLKACVTLYNPTDLDRLAWAWDTIRLKDIGFGAIPSGTGDCERTVTFQGRCYYGGAANYAMWGKANRLCFDTFGTRPISLWSLQWAEEIAFLWKVFGYHKFGDEEFEAMAFTAYGYGLPLLHPGISSCPASKTSDRHYAFQFRWLPYRNPDHRP